MNLKKGLIFLTLCSVLSIASFAQERTSGHTKAEITYRSAPIYKILDSKETYVVLYGKYGTKVGSVNVPKKWAQWQKDTPRKLEVRKLPTRIEPYITVLERDGEFVKVILTVPTEKNNPVWGIASATRVDNSEPDSIKLELR